MKVLLAIIIGLQPPAGAAPSLEKLVGKVHVMRDHVKEDYAKTVGVVMLSSIADHYGSAQYDHVVVKTILEERAQRGLKQLRQIERTFDEAVGILNEASSRWDESAIQALASVAEAQSAVIEAESIDRDATTILASWNERCDPTQVRRIAAQYDPSSYEALAEMDPVAPISPRADLSIELQFGSDLTREGTHATVRPSMKSTDTDAAVVGTGTALLTTTPVGVVIGVVILVGWSLIKLGIYADQVVQNARKEGELYDYLSDIRKIQLAVLNAASRHVSATSTTLCERTFPTADAPHLYSDVFQSYLVESRSLWERLKHKRSHLFAAYARRIEALDTEYFPQLKRSMAEGIAQRFADAKVRRNAVFAVNATEFAPALESLRQNTDEKTRWLNKDQIWSALIEADASLRVGEGFSFTSPTTTTASPERGPRDWGDGLGRSVIEVLGEK